MDYVSALGAQWAVGSEIITLSLNVKVDGNVKRDCNVKTDGKLSGTSEKLENLRK